MLTKQEMFDRAVRGLRAQDWRKAEITVKDDELGRTTRCVYFDPATGLRCAWGHVDPEGTKHGPMVNVWGLHQDGIGLAAGLEGDEFKFAEEIQGAHDDGSEEGRMEARFRRIGEKHGLVWPEENPPKAEDPSWHIKQYGGAF